MPAYQQAVLRRQLSRGTLSRAKFTGGRARWAHASGLQRNMQVARMAYLAKESSERKKRDVRPDDAEVHVPAKGDVADEAANDPRISGDHLEQMLKMAGTVDA